MSWRARVSRKRMTLLAGLIALAILAGVSVMQAMAPVLGVCIYYSDSTYTEVVGARGTGCCGRVINSGIVTEFRRCERIYCPDVLCPN